MIAGNDIRKLIRISLLAVDACILLTGVPENLESHWVCDELMKEIDKI